MTTPGAHIDGLLGRMGALLEPMVAEEDPRRFFLAVYMRTTAAVKAELVAPSHGGFEDTAWTEAWDIAFADLYLDALQRWNEDGSAPGPWQVAFIAGSDGLRVPPIRHLLLGMNAHINYDLPQALLAVISDEEFDDADLVERRARDHRRIDDILASRVPQEDRLLKSAEQPGDRTALDKALTPFNRAGTKRFLREARGKVWRNARVLTAARSEGPAAMKARLDELGARSAERVADLRRPGQVLLRLSREGFGILLEGA